MNVWIEAIPAHLVGVPAFATCACGQPASNVLVTELKRADPIDLDILGGGWTETEQVRKACCYACARRGLLDHTIVPTEPCIP